VHQRGEVGIAGADGERGHEAALVGQLDRVHRHLDIGRVLPRAADPLRDLDQLDLCPGQQPAVLVEAGPVRVGPPRHHPAPLGQRVGDRTEVERHDAQPVPGSDCEILVVEKQRDAFIVIGHSNSR
jgi:hypothetical protein